MVKFLFRPTQRIKRQKEIASLVQKGRRWKNNDFSLIFIENEYGFDRVAVIVSRRNGIAVARNRIKRVWREIARTTAAAPPYFNILICPHGTRAGQTETLRKKYESWRNTVTK
jgi:ribonuclease P protein component